MKINVSEQAANWYKQEIITSLPYVRFYPRYGYGGHIPGFSVGVSNDQPEEVHASSQVDNLTFYVEEKDAWYFEGVNLDITWNEQLKEPKILFK